MTVSCSDVCDSGDGPGGSNSIYFTALTVNTDKPSVFSISPEGDDMQTVIEDGIIFSGPSKDGKLVYLAKDYNEKDIIYTFNIRTGDRKALIRDIDIFEKGLSFPVISPDGIWVSFIGGSNSMYLKPDTSAFAYRVTSVLYENCLPSFSPDGRYIAYFEQSSKSFKLRITNISADNRVDVFSKEFLEGDLNHNKQPTVAWSNDGNKVIYSVRVDTTDFLYFHDIVSGTETIYEMKNIGASMPDFSSNDDFMIVFVSNKGELWTRQLDSADPDFKMLVSSGEFDINSFPFWSDDGISILYHNYFILDDQQYQATLNIYKFSDGIGENLILSNNVYRGFWKRN